jgi:hypothetical protein
MVSGGFEIIIGWVKFNIEGGMDLITSSLYGNVGLRFGY